MLREHIGRRPSASLRRRQCTHPTVCSTDRTSNSDDPWPAQEPLDLSCVHHAADSRVNRFSPLVAITTPTKPRPASVITANGPRHRRHSRGTKQAKRRRDFRRNQRKIAAAAHLLDAKLGHAIDSALSPKAFEGWPRRVDIPRVYIEFQPWDSKPQLVSREIGEPLSTSTVEPPKLSLDPESFPSLVMRASPTEGNQRSANGVPPSRALSRPPVCLQKLSVADVWKNRTFTSINLLSLLDVPRGLSALHKLKESNQRKQIQSYQPLEEMLRRKHSRFFPSKIPETSTIKLPLLPSVLPYELTSELDRSTTAVDSCSRAHQSHELVKRRVSEFDTPNKNAANLWQILSSEQPSVYRDLEAQHRQPAQQQPPVELDGIGLQTLVKHNACVGVSSSGCRSYPTEPIAAQEPSDFFAEEDSGVCLPTLPASNEMNCPNELLVDNDITPPRPTTPLLDTSIKLPLPVSPPLTPTARSVQGLFASHLKQIFIDDLLREGYQQAINKATLHHSLHYNQPKPSSDKAASVPDVAERRGSVAHFLSEASLFALPSPLTCPSAPKLERCDTEAYTDFEDVVFITSEDVSWETCVHAAQADSPARPTESGDDWLLCELAKDVVDDCQVAISSEHIPLVRSASACELEHGWDDGKFDVSSTTLRDAVGYDYVADEMDFEFEDWNDW